MKNNLRQAVGQADRVFWGWDEDREGEVISWHLAQELRLYIRGIVITSEQ